MISRKKRILSLLLAVSMLLSSGCGKKKDKPLLEGTILENARVFNCDGNIIIGVYESVYASNHPHFRDIISGVLFAKEKCNYQNVKTFDNMEELGLITSFLTEEELIKITSDQYTDDDVSNILIRITTSDLKNEDDSKTLTLTGK